MGEEGIKASRPRGNEASRGGRQKALGEDEERAQRRRGAEGEGVMEDRVLVG